MEEVNRNEHMIKNILSAIDGMENEEKIRNYIKNIEPSTYSQMGIYTRCINDLKLISDSDLKGDKYLCRIKQTCQNYLEYAIGIKYNATQYSNSYRKEHYKQLNVDIPKDIMDQFEKCLKENQQIKKNVILDFITEYIDNNTKEKK